jgi:hypothetical protein
MAGATHCWLRQVLDLQRVALLAGFGLFAFACGEKFTGVDAAAGGSSGSSNAGSSAMPAAGSAAGGDGATDGGVDAGGSAPTAGKAAGGRGGLSSVAGSGGKPSNGGSGGNGGNGGVVVEVPPVSQDGLDLWFDANLGVKEANGVVVSWQDRSGHRRDALQTSTLFRPKLAKSALGGKAGIVFDGVDDYLRIATVPGDFSLGVSIFVVMQQEVDVAPCTGFFEASNGSEIDDVHVGTWQNALLYEVADKWVNPTEHPLLLAQPQLVAVVQQTTEAVQLRRNSNALVDSDVALPATIAREAFIGHTAYEGCQPFTGAIGEILLYGRAVSDSELIDIESYLNTKWACCAE